MIRTAAALHRLRAGSDRRGVEVFGARLADVPQVEQAVPSSSASSAGRSQRAPAADPRRSRLDSAGTSRGGHRSDPARRARGAAATRVGARAEVGRRLMVAFCGSVFCSGSWGRVVGPLRRTAPAGAGRCELVVGRRADRHRIHAVTVTSGRGTGILDTDAGLDGPTASWVVARWRGRGVRRHPRRHRVRLDPGPLRIDHRGGCGDRTGGGGRAGRRADILPARRGQPHRSAGQSPPARALLVRAPRRRHDRRRGHRRPIIVFPLPAVAAAPPRSPAPRDSFVRLADGYGTTDQSAYSARRPTPPTRSPAATARRALRCRRSRRRRGRPRPPTTRRCAGPPSGGGPYHRRLVQALTGLRITHFASVDLAGFADVSQAIGGVPVCLRPSTTVLPGSCCPAAPSW